jgi:hypothetical protein
MVLEGWQCRSSKGNLMPIGPQSLQNFQASNFNTDTNEGVWKAKQDANSAIASQLAGLY